MRVSVFGYLELGENGLRLPQLLVPGGRDEAGVHLRVDLAQQGLLLAQLQADLARAVGEVGRNREQRRHVSAHDILLRTAASLLVLVVFI